MKTLILSLLLAPCVMFGAWTSPWAKDTKVDTSGNTRIIATNMQQVVDYIDANMVEAGDGFITESGLTTLGYVTRTNVNTFTQVQTFPGIIVNGPTSNMWYGWKLSLPAANTYTVLTTAVVCSNLTNQVLDPQGWIAVGDTKVIPTVTGYYHCVFTGMATGDYCQVMLGNASNAYETICSTTTNGYCVSGSAMKLQTNGGYFNLQFKSAGSTVLTNVTFSATYIGR